MATHLSCTPLVPVLGTVQWLLAEGGADISDSNNRGYTALLLSSLNDHLGTVKWLLAECGADINESNKYIFTALLISCSNGQLGTVQWLLAEGGADINESNIDGPTIILLYDLDLVPFYLRSSFEK